MASYPKRSRSFVTKVVCTPEEQETRRASSAAVPPEQQRLVFGTSASAFAPCADQDPLVAELQATQAIIFKDRRALGRLVKPRVLVDSLSGESAPGSRVSLIYDYWQPASVDQKHEPIQHLRIPLDSRYSSVNVFSVCPILSGKPPVALPSQAWSGRETAAAVNQQQQKLDYIRKRQKHYTEGEGKDSPNRHLLARSDAEYTIDTGPDWQKSPLSLTFNIAGDVPWLQRIILKLLAILKAPVDVNGGPIGDTSAEVTISSSSAGASGLIDMASASTQPVPQGHSGPQQAGEGAQQPVNDSLPQGQSTGQPVTTTCAAVECAPGKVQIIECAGADATPGGAQKPETGSPSPSGVRLGSGGAADSYRRVAMQPRGSAGEGGGEPNCSSSDSEDEGAAQGQSGGGQGWGAASNGGADMGGRSPSGGAGSGGDREGPRRERGRGKDTTGSSPRSGRKRTEKLNSDASGNAEAKVVEPPAQQPQAAGTPSSSPAAPSSGHSHGDRDAAASLQQASSMSTTMDTADASSDAADEQQQAGIAESKPTVKLIPNGEGLACRAGGGALHAAATQAPSAEPAMAAVASQGKPLCSSDAGSEGGAATDMRTFPSECCGREQASRHDSAAGSGPEGESRLAVPEKALGASVAAPEAGGGRAPGLSTSRRRYEEAGAANSSVSVEASVNVATRSSAGGSTADAGCNEMQPSQPAALNIQSAPPPLQQPQQQLLRIYPNGISWSQPHSKSSSHGVEQQQAQPQLMGVTATSHLPHLPHGVYGHPVQNGKVRNGELFSDPALLTQQLLPALVALASGQGLSGSGAIPSGAQQQLHSQSAGQSHAFGNGMDSALLQQVLLAQANGALQLPHAGSQLGGQHLQSGAGVYGFMLHQHQQAQVQQQQAHLMQLLQPQYQQHASQQQQQVQQQQAVQQQQQLFLQGLAHAQQGLAEPQYMIAGAPPEFFSFYPAASAVSGSAVLTSPSAATQAAVEPCALPGDASKQHQPSQVPAAAAVQPLHLPPIAAPTPTLGQLQNPGFQADSSVQAAWDSRSEPSTAMAAPVVERPIGPQHRNQSHGNILAGAHGGGGGGHMGPRDGGGRSSGYRGHTSFSGVGGGAPSGPGGGGGASSSGASGGGQAAAMMQGGGAYGNRPYGGPGGGSRHGGGGGQGYTRGGGRYDGSSAENSRPSSRGPHPHGGGGGGHLRHPNSADPVPPPEALPLPDPKGSCDLDRFISQVEPVIALDREKPRQQALQDLRLRDLWNFYFEPSLFGREVFTLGGHRGASNAYFVPYLSAIQLFTRAQPSDVGGTNRLYVSEDNQGWPKHMHLKFEYFEEKMPYQRHPLYEQIQLLAKAMAAGPGASRSRPAVTVPDASSAPTPSTPAAPALASATYAPAGADAPGTVAAAGSPTASNGAEPADTGGGDPSAEGSTAANSGPDAVRKADHEGAAAAAWRPSRSDGAPQEAGGSAGPEGAQGAAAGAEPAAACGSAPPPQAAAPAVAPDADSAIVDDHVCKGLLYDMRLLDVHPASWFAVAWYPVYRIPDAPLYARFLTFHSFAPLVTSMWNGYNRLDVGQVAPCDLLSLPVVGLLWYNMQGERWMEPLEESRPHGGLGAPAISANSPRGQQHRGGRVSGMDVWYQNLLQNYQSTAERLARGSGLKVLGQHGAEEVRLTVSDYEFFRTRIG